MGFITEIKSLNEVPQFEVEKVQVFDGNRRCIDGVYSLQRSDTNQHLGMVKDKYRPIQMNEMIDIISEASDKVGDIDHIGYTTSKGGRKVVIQSKYRDTLDVGGDKIDGEQKTIKSHYFLPYSKFLMTVFSSLQRFVLVLEFSVCKTFAKQNVGYY